MARRAAGLLVTALVCAGALDYPATIELVRFRGQVMQEAVPAGSGAMAAILGLDDEALLTVCREAAGGAVVEAVNFNCPGQVVIAGDAPAVQRAIDAAKSRGAKRAVTLPVSVPSHSSLMRGAGERLRAKLETLALRAPAIPYVSAVDARAHAEPADILDVLVRRLRLKIDEGFEVKLIHTLRGAGYRLGLARDG